MVSGGGGGAAANHALVAASVLSVQLKTRRLDTHQRSLEPCRRRQLLLPPAARPRSCGAGASPAPPTR